MNEEIEHLDFDPYSFAEHVSRLTLAMGDLEALLTRRTIPRALARLDELAAEFRRQERRRELRRKRERRRRRQQAGRRR